MAAIIWAVFLASNVTVGFCLYRLGLHGQLRRHMKAMEEPMQAKAERKAKEPTKVPGSEYAPQFENDAGYNYLDLDGDDFSDTEDYSVVYATVEELEQQAVEEDPDVPYKNQVVMTGGYRTAEETV